jgi:hypothetical protein
MFAFSDKLCHPFPSAVPWHLKQDIWLCAELAQVSCDGLISWQLAQVLSGLAAFQYV